MRVGHPSRRQRWIRRLHMCVGGCGDLRVMNMVISTSAEAKLTTGRTQRVSGGDDAARERILGKRFLFQIIFAHYLSNCPISTNRE